MTELEYVLNGFDEHFAMFRDKRIVLHGSREYAEAIVRRFADSYHFTGVMSCDYTDGATFHGLPFFGKERLQNGGIDMVILTERVKYAEAVYLDICEICRNNGIMLYNMYGLDEMAAHRDFMRCIPLRYVKWQELCRGYDVVAFEAMDTLLTGPDLIVRYSFRKLIRWLLAQDKEVYISLRKSFPAEKQTAALETAVLFEDLIQHLVYRQGEDLSFRTLREANPGKKILYIGSGLVNEFLLPRCYGIDTYYYKDPAASFGMPVLKNNPTHIEYDENRRERILLAIRECEVVSFDVFDTLLLRRTLRPEDVFCLAESRIKAAGYAAGSFAEVRQNAEKQFSYGTIYEIYDLIGRHYGWSDDTEKKMLDLELSIEDDVIVPRTEVVELMDYAASAGKTVVLTSDMYLPEPLMRQLLAKKGIRSFDRLFISCDYKCSKISGLFEEVCALADLPEAVLHIGNDVSSDLLAAAACGIRAERIPAVSEMAAECGWASAGSAADSLMERCMLGMSLAELFRDPFQNPNIAELPTDERLRRFAASVVGPLASGYMTWLIKKLHEDTFDGVLFLARDGYLPISIYREMQKNTRLPKPVYFYANRHSTFLCCSDDVSRIRDVIGQGALYELDPAEILKRVYDLPAARLFPPAEGETDAEYILRHMPLIKERAGKAREAYKLYSDRCGIREDGTYAVVDFIAAGSTQQNMESFLQCSMKGFYFGSYGSDSRIDIPVELYMDSDGKSISRNYIELEGFFISPEPSLNYIGENGEPVFAPELRSEEELREFGKVFSIALEYAVDFFRLFYQEDEVICPELPEEMFATEGCHRVLQYAYDDFCGEKIPEKAWQ